MDQHLHTNILHQLETTAKALCKNHMDTHVVEDLESLHRAIRELLPSGAVICSGGSMTLAESGVNQLLLEGDYDFYHRSRIDDAGNPLDVYRKAFSCDWYFSSSNAITMDGKLYNVDGTGNRVAALSFGPKNVVIVAGYNKVVKDLAAAEERLKAFAAPANCVRLDRKTGCRQTGHCMDCHNDDRICCTAVIHDFQRDAGRIKVFLLPMELGY